MIEVVESLVKERKPHLPCRIEYPNAPHDVLHGTGWGAIVVKEDRFRVLFSDGKWISPQGA